jgi:hypothetical protein
MWILKSKEEFSKTYEAQKRHPIELENPKAIMRDTDRPADRKSA